MIATIATHETPGVGWDLDLERGQREAAMCQKCTRYLSRAQLPCTLLLAATGEATLWQRENTKGSFLFAPANRTLQPETRRACLYGPTITSALGPFELSSLCTGTLCVRHTSQSAVKRDALRLQDGLSCKTKKQIVQEHVTETETERSRNSLNRILPPAAHNSQQRRWLAV